MPPSVPPPMDASPYAPPRAVLTTPQAHPAWSVPAGFWVRAAAYLVDMFVLSVFAFMAGVACAIVLGEHGGEQVAQLLTLLVSIAYFALQESSTYQATLGKRAMGLIVVDAHGERLSALHALGRYVAKALNWITLGVGWALAGWTDRKRGLHDMVASTQVVFVDSERTTMPTLGWIVLGLYALLLVVVFVGVLLVGALAAEMAQH